MPKVRMMTLIEVDVPDEACMGCATVAMSQGLTAVIEETGLFVTDTDNCANPTAEFQMDLIEAVVVGLVYVPENGSKRSMH